MVAPIYFTTPDDFTRGHLVELKGKCFSLDESKHFVPDDDITCMRLRNVLLRNGIDKVGIITFLIVFNRLALLTYITAVVTVTLGWKCQNVKIFRA